MSIRRLTMAGIMAAIVIEGRKLGNDLAGSISQRDTIDAWEALSPGRSHEYRGRRTNAALHKRAAKKLRNIRARSPK